MAERGVVARRFRETPPGRQMLVEVNRRESGRGGGNAKAVLR
jgi:hypothetical protein